MSHNWRNYSRKIKKRTADQCKKVDVLFKQQKLSLLSSTDNIVSSRPTETAPSIGTASPSTSDTCSVEESLEVFQPTAFQPTIDTSCCVEETESVAHPTASPPTTATTCSVEKSVEVVQPPTASPPTTATTCSVEESVEVVQPPTASPPTTATTCSVEESVEVVQPPTASPPTTATTCAVEESLDVTLPAASPPTDVTTCAVETDGSGRTLSPVKSSGMSFNSPSGTGSTSRKIIFKYESMYTWLYFSTSRSGFRCKVCEMFGNDPLSSRSESPFLLGTQLGDHPQRKLDCHQNSSSHRNANDKFVAINTELNDVKSTESIKIMFKKIKQAETDSNQNKVDRNRRYIGALISTLFFIVKKRWSLDSIAGMVQLLEELECKSITQYLETKPLNQYVSPTSVSQLLCAIDTHLEKNILQTIRDAKFFALMADESTDEANRNQFAIVIRCLSGDKMEDHFLGLINVKRADAATLMEAIESFLVLKGVDIGKAVFVGFDGCNTMSGVNKGLQRRFRHVVPHQVYINCRNHKLALCVKHLMNSFPVLKDVDSVLLAIWKVFEFSPQRFAVFKDVQASYNLTELSLIRAAATRWLSHGTACCRLIERYEQVVDTLDTIIEQKREPEIIGIRDMITAKNTVSAICILGDLLVPVNIFSKYLQGSVVDFSEVSLKLKELTDTLHAMVGRFQATLVVNNESDLLFSKLDSLFGVIDERTVYTRRLRDHDVYTARQIVEEIATPMTLGLINEIEDSFHCSPVLKAFSVLNLQQLPDTILELDSYGKADIATLAGHYGAPKEDVFTGHRNQVPALLDGPRMTAEFSGFKHHMFIKRQQSPEDDLLKLFLKDEILRTTYPTMFDLCVLLRLIPSSTAVVERVFSLMNSLCTNTRSRLKQSTLIALMHICHGGGASLSDAEKESIIDIFNASDRQIAL